MTTTGGLAWADELRVVESASQWQYLVLAVNGVSGRLCWDWTSNMTSQALAGVVAQWGPEGLSTVVWDRARGHGGTVSDAIPVQRLVQPAYSPALNPAERELRELSASPERMQRLAGWAWIREALAGWPE